MSYVEEIDRLTASIEVIAARLRANNHPEDAIRFALLHVDAALSGRSRPLAMAERERDEARAALDRVRAWMAEQPPVFPDLQRAIDGDRS